MTPCPLKPGPRRKWEEFLSRLAPRVREVAEAYPPWKTYVIMLTGQVVKVRSYEERENGSVRLRVHVPEWLNSRDVPRGHDVFGLMPEDLEVLDA